MKIAVNKCFGGFDLSDKVCEKLIELGIPHFKSCEEMGKDYNGLYVVDSDYPSLEKYYTNLSDKENRTNPLLIQAIEEVGEKESSGRFGEIRIIEIPDNIEYEIDDYDGIESIHECHRSW